MGLLHYKYYCLLKKKNRDVYPILIGCIYLVSVVYNSSLQLRRLSSFVFIL